MTTAEAENGSALAASAGRLSEFAERSLRELDAEAIRHRAEDWIKDRPLTSVLVAISAGFLLGRLLRS